MSGYKKKLEKIYEGRDETPKDEAAYPNPGQLWNQLLTVDPEYRLKILGKLLEALESNNQLVRSGYDFLEKVDAEMAAQKKVTDSLVALSEEMQRYTASHTAKSHEAYGVVSEFVNSERAAVTAMWLDRLLYCLREVYLPDTLTKRPPV